MSEINVPYGFLNGSAGFAEITNLAMLNQPCYVIQFMGTETVHIPGDERSRTNPGHGYPERNETFTVTRQFYTKDFSSFQSAIQSLVDRKDRGQYTFAAYQLVPAKITRTVTVEVGL